MPEGETEQDFVRNFSLTIFSLGLCLTMISRSTRCSVRLCSKHVASAITSASLTDPAAVLQLQEARATSPMMMTTIFTVKQWKYI